MIKQIKGLFKIEYFLLFLIAFELFDKHHLFIFVLFLYLLKEGMIHHVPLKLDFLCVLFWCISYYIFGTTTFSILHVPALLCAFFIGYCLTVDKTSVFYLLLIIGVGYGLQGLLTVYFSSDLTIYAEDEMSRSIMSLWGRPRGVTSMIVTFFIFSGIFVYILMNKTVKLGWKVLSLFFELGFFLVSLRIAARSPLVFCPIILMISLVAYNSRKVNVKSLLLGLLIALFIFIFYEVNIFSIKTIYENSYLSIRISEQYDGGLLDNGRFDLQSRFINVMSMDIYGGLHKKIGYYFHNVWLDMYAFSGLLGFLSFIVLTIRLFINFIIVFRRSDNEERSVWAGVFAAFVLPMYFEPLYWAAPAYFTFLFIFYGMLSKRRYIFLHERLASSYQVF